MVDDPLITARVSMQADKSRVQANQHLNSASAYAIIQEAQADDFITWSESLNPVAVAVRRFDTLETRLRRQPKEATAEKTEPDELEITVVDMLEQISEQFQQKNPELQSKNLQLLRARIKPDDSAEDILKKVTESYPDEYLADEALDFLQTTSTGQLAATIKQCKQQFNELHRKEIQAGKNISAYALDFAKQDLNSPTGLRGLYQDVTSNPRDPQTLFNELSTQYPYEKMNTVISFLLHSLGHDLKSKGPSISRGELHRLLSDTRSLQAILGVYRYFKSRMPLINSSFTRNDLAPSTRITFQLLAKLFVKFLMERYPSADKVLQLGVQMGLEDEMIAELIIFTQMRDAVRQVAPKLFRNDPHRQEVLKIFIETLEELEEKLDEESDEESEK